MIAFAPSQAYLWRYFVCALPNIDPQPQTPVAFLFYVIIKRTLHLATDMKFSLLLTALCATSFSYAFPSQDTTALSLRAADAIPETYTTLEKRRGGGGGKGGGKGSGSSSSGSSGGRPASSYSFSPSSNAGGRTISGSGLKPSYPGGRYVGGKSG